MDSTLPLSLGARRLPGTWPSVIATTMRAFARWLTGRLGLQSGISQSFTRLNRGSSGLIYTRLSRLTLFLRARIGMHLGDLWELSGILSGRYYAPEFTRSCLIAVAGFLLGRIYALPVRIVLRFEVNQAIGFLGKLLRLAGEQIVFRGIQLSLDGWVREAYVVGFYLGRFRFRFNIRLSYNQRRWLYAALFFFLFNWFRLCFYDIYYFVSFIGF